MKKLVFVFVIVLLFAGWQMASAQEGEYAYPVDGDYAYPITNPEQGLPEDAHICDHAPHMSPETCDEYFAEPPPSHPIVPAQPIVDNTPTKEVVNQNIVNMIMATNQLLRANRIRRPVVIPARNVLDNLFRLEFVK